MHRFCVAPMMEWTDRHDRYFLRLISRHARLYTEMVTAAAVLNGDRARLIGFHASEHPVALQVGGSDPSALAECARIAEGFGYDEINLNVGCPSDRVQTGRFGACLMREPDLVADCVDAMTHGASLPVTVKCRVGVDDQDPEQSLFAFVDKIAAAGATTLIIHARKAWLDGLSPKQNRDVPPLDYDLVYRVKVARPHLEIVINGGIDSVDDGISHLDRVDGIMLGRAAYHTPYVLADVDRRLFGAHEPPPPRADIIERFLPYVDRQWRAGVPLHAMTRHILGLFHGQPGARAWRRHLSEGAHRAGASPALVGEALAFVSRGQIEAAA